MAATTPGAIHDRRHRRGHRRHRRRTARRGRRRHDRQSGGGRGRAVRPARGRARRPRLHRRGPGRRRRRVPDASGRPRGRHGHPRRRHAGRAHRARRRAARDRLAEPVVGITGSVGKTSTKDLLAAVLATAAPHRRPASSSFNNELGVPLTLRQRARRHRGGRRRDGRPRRSATSPPLRDGSPDRRRGDRVAAVHTSEFEDIDDIAATKAELVEALGAGGTAVLNADDPRVLAMAKRRPEPS